MLTANFGFIRPVMSRVVAYSRIHYKCRNTGFFPFKLPQVGILYMDKPYLRSDVYRIKVPHDKVSWDIDWPEYDPEDFTSLAAIGKPWADSNDIGSQKFNWNDSDGLVNRLSYMGKYDLDKTGRPLNPAGRTGLRGRGVLGKWGPNHAADPIVSRIHHGQLQFVGIARRDSGEWAIPGGMVDAGEDIHEALKREFTEEALDGKNYPELDVLWRKGVELYRGYVDDPRNTDNAWMETVVVNFHDSDGCLNDIMLKAGDDAVKVRWITVPVAEKLYASHEDFIKLLVECHGV